jgi:sulfoxide reductase catalytic subunit YedY
MSRSSTPLSRRQFVLLGLVGAASTLVEAACRASPSPIATTIAPTSTPDPIATATLIPSPTPKTVGAATPEAVATATPAPSPTPEVVATFPPLSQNTPKLLKNRNDPNYNVRYVNPFPPVDREAWRLEVAGLVNDPGSFSLEDLLAWPQMEQISRMKCVECWSFKAKWGGFQYGALAERAMPQPEATHVRFDCADAYWEIVSIEELADPRVVFVLRMNDSLLLDEYGAPLRMMFPAKYGYKSAKAVTTVTFTAEDGAGYWSTVGAYTTHGDIQAGVDLPQDLRGERKQIEGGEITAY